MATTKKPSEKKQERISTPRVADDVKMPSVQKPGPLSTPRVMLLGAALLLFATLGFHNISGMIDEKATGSHLVNAFYCSVMTLTTVGFGDICPSDHVSSAGRAFIVMMSMAGLGMFCGPIMELASSWKDSVPGGLPALASVTLAVGVIVFSYIEEMSEFDAAYLSFIIGTTIGYGDVTPRSDMGKIAVAFYAILVINVMGALLTPAKIFLESFCREVSIEKSKKEPPVESIKED